MSSLRMRLMPLTFLAALASPSALARPWTLGLSAPGGSELLGRVIGTTSDARTIEARATFVEGERRVLQIYLASGPATMR